MLGNLIETQNASRSMTKKNAIAGCIVVVATLALLFGPTLKHIALICWNEEDYSHGLLLPFISAYFLYERRRELREFFVTSSAAPVPFSSIGLALLIAGLLIFYLGSVSSISFVSWFGFFPTALGAMYLMFGTAVAPFLTTPLLLNYMAKPIPDSLVPKLFFPLQVLAAKISAWVLEALNVPIYVSGNIIEIPHMQLMVEEACSGMRSVFALLTVAIVVLYAVKMPFLYKVLVFISALVTAVVLNVCRVAATGLLAHFYDPETARGFFHSFAGMVVFLVGLVILYSIGSFFSRLAARKNASETTP